MPFVPVSAIKTLHEGSLLIAKTPFWTVSHDLARGGAPVEIAFTNGQAGNVLRSPMSVEVDDLSDRHCRNTKVRQRRAPRGVELVFQGFLARPDGSPSAVRFRTTYVYTPYAIRREVEIDFGGPGKARVLAPMGLSVDGRFTHFSASHDPHTKGSQWDSGLGPSYFAYFNPVPSRRGEFFRDPWPVGWVTLHRTGGEAMQIVPCGDLTVWDAPAGQTGMGRFTLARVAEGVDVAFRALATGAPVRLPCKLVFAASIALLNLPASHRLPMRMVMIGNPPFPDDATLKLWADSGVELLEIMEGTRWVGNREEPAKGNGYWRSGTDRFWRMGGYPPYSRAEDMADLARLVKSAHRYGMKVVPYTAPEEFHPEVPEFCKNVLKWRQQPVPDGGTVFHSTGNYPGAIWGALVCPDSPGVRKHYLGFAKKYVRNFGFDGIYTDLVSKVFCHNTEHGSAHHGGIDGLLEVLIEMREFLGPDRLIIAHNGDCNMLVAVSNLADNVVTMEALNSGQKTLWDLATIQPYIRAFQSCPNLMIPSYSWYHKRSLASPAALRDGIAKGVLLGSMPYHLDIYFQADKWGYKDIRQYVRDDEQVFGLYRRLAKLDLSGMRFEDALTGVVNTNRKGVLGARYVGDGRQIIVLSNLTTKTQRNIRWQCGRASGLVRMLRAKDYQFMREGT